MSYFGNIILRSRLWTKLEVNSIIETQDRPTLLVSKSGNHLLLKRLQAQYRQSESSNDIQPLYVFLKLIRRFD
jgi:hypothetical protein